MNPKSRKQEKTARVCERFFGRPKSDFDFDIALQAVDQVGFAAVHEDSETVHVVGEFGLPGNVGHALLVVLVETKRANGFDFGSFDGFSAAGNGDGRHEYTSLSCLSFDGFPMLSNSSFIRNKWERLFAGFRIDRTY